MLCGPRRLTCRAPPFERPSGEQLRKDLDLVVNLVHGFSIPGLKTRHDDLDIVVIRRVGMMTHDARALTARRAPM